MYTGPNAPDWAGHVIGKNCSAEGNIFAGPQVPKAMANASENTQGSLAMRLMAALDAGEKAADDKRGMQSGAAAIAVTSAVSSAA